MKKLLMLMVTGMILFSCNNGETETAVAKNSDWTTQNLKGMVKSIEQSTYTPDSTGKIGAMDSCCINTDEFDEKGYTTSSAKKDSKGNAGETTSFAHYDKGQMKSVSNSKNGKVTGGFEIDIDKDGKYTGARELDSAGKSTFYYTGLTEDDYGSVTSGTRHKKDSSVDGVFKSEYTKGIQVGNSYTDSSGKQVYTSKSELNDKGDVAKTTETNVGKDSTTTTVTTYTYDSRDEQGNWTQRTTINDKGKATKVTKRTITYYKKD
jgi:hypothetical protein